MLFCRIVVKISSFEVLLRTLVDDLGVIFEAVSNNLVQTLSTIGILPSEYNQHVPCSVSDLVNYGTDPLVRDVPLDLGHDLGILRQIGRAHV